MKRPVVAFAGLTACSGCQLTLLNCEEELARLSASFDFAYFPLGNSSLRECTEFDAAFVEGAVSTPADLATLMQLRSSSRYLVAFGTCALWGGIAAMDNDQPRELLAAAVYGEAGRQMATFSPAPFDRFVQTDLSIPGCPPEKGELLVTLAALLRDTLPVLPVYPVCTECRNRENRCLLIEDDLLCLGPLIRAGCNARCPAAGIVCEGCRGPAAEVNVAAEVDLLVAKGYDRETIETRLRRFYPEWDHERRY
ncbi:NADH:ubiquinone oxidoreductase [Geobacter sp. DSM 9736]|uniref:NADH-quinone oxidoreductase subunit B family protein n=1 Tax=Geobacter sp. DSM 9736 TaxID=1277350 RepID=UPI000B508DAE|nr:NADH:ubiquinone oxidoreductase [Geobacter sp. DSM 9736]SNB46025.1 Coenzyme F420-reducing hydrogenase, gamma subunit [Geobacter sp. DSM 9736]